MKGTTPLARLAVGICLPIIGAALPVLAASPDPLTDACGLAFRQSTNPPEGVVWIEHNDQRIVLFGVKGDRFECLFDGDGKLVPELLSVETEGADKSVTVLSGKKLDELNTLIQQHFSKSGVGKPAS